MKKLAASLAVVGALMFGAVELVWADTTSWDDQSGAKQPPEYFGTIFDVSEKEGWVFEVLYNDKNSEPEVRLGLYNEETKHIYLYSYLIGKANSEIR